MNGLRHPIALFRLPPGVALLTAMIFSIAPPLGAADSVVALMYHRFGEDKFPSTNIRVEQFEAHLQHLQSGGYTVVPLSAVVEALTENRDLPERAVVITIDDAYRSVYDVAFPRFEELGVPFTVFVATDPVDQGLPGYMSWDQMRQMAEAGATFANHGASHGSVIERLQGEDDPSRLARVKEDVEKGWRRLREELDPLPGVFAYPYGEYDLAAASLIRDMGYLAFGQQSGAIGRHSDVRALPRFPMAEAFGELPEFRTKIASLPMPVGSVEPWDPVVSTDLPNVTVTLRENDLGLDRLACFVSGQGRVEVEWVTSKTRFRVGPIKPFPVGRHRVNCTVPHQSGRFLWFSHPWIVQQIPETLDPTHHHRR
jgi:peptidoglycan/xylan/chitin deacetylase (PgdA/CDA1 family)